MFIRLDSIKIIELLIKIVYLNTQFSGEIQLTFGCYFSKLLKLSIKIETVTYKSTYFEPQSLRLGNT